jgi:hypothetical protein
MCPNARAQPLDLGDQLITGHRCQIVVHDSSVEAQRA